MTTPPTKAKLSMLTLTAVIDQLKDGVVTADLQGNIISMNKAAMRMYGFKKPADYQKNQTEYQAQYTILSFPGRRRLSQSLRPLARLLKDKHLNTTVVLKPNQKDKKERIINYRGQLIISKNKKPILAILLLRDVTKEKRILREREELLALNKVKDEFISLASHQLRTPATAVKQFVGMVLDGYVGPLKKSQRELLTYALDSNERQLQVISDLLKVAQVDAGKVELFREKHDIASLLKAVVKEQRKNVRARSQSIRLHIKKGSYIGNVDVNRLRMVFENLIDNASKYSQEGKQIDVYIKHDKRYIAVSVKDEGVGLSEKDIKKLFQKFSRLESPLSVMGGGSGLGLYWAKEIVSLHGGSIKVESEPNKGSIFTVKIIA